MTHRSRINGAVFSPEALKSMDNAYRQTLRSLTYASMSEDPESEQRIRTVAAQTILELAASGERDSDRLHERAYLRAIVMEIIG